jgi:two-component system, sporulation sensor kinase E
MMEGISVLFQESMLESSLIQGDPDKLKQVLLNLFKNSFEAMTSGGLLTIQLGIDVRSNIVLSVTDNGKGMTKSQINQLFMPFFTSKPEGTGLGLPFVLKTMEEYGGTISVESEPEKGATFILTFLQAKIEKQLIQKESSTI